MLGKWRDFFFTFFFKIFNFNLVYEFLIKQQGIDANLTQLVELRWPTVNEKAPKDLTTTVIHEKSEFGFGFISLPIFSIAISVSQIILFLKSNSRFGAFIDWTNRTISQIGCLSLNFSTIFHMIGFKQYPSIITGRLYRAKSSRHV